MSNPIQQVKLDQVSKKFVINNRKLAVLEDISLQVLPGQILAVLDRSGAGKTTLLNLISGLETPNSGQVQVDGTMGYITQKDLLLLWRTVLNNVLLPLEIKRKIIQVDTEFATNLLDQLGLKKFINSRPNEISGGMKQKAVWARLLVQDPKIILFDEPFSAVDFVARLKLVEQVRLQIINNHKIGIFVTHNIEEALVVADKVVVLAGQPSKVVFECLANTNNPIDTKTNFDKICQILNQDN